MATLATLPGIHSLILKRVVEERKGHQQISEELKALYPGVRGLSARSVRRFCDEQHIHTTSRLSDEDLDRVVSSSVAKV